MLSPKRSRLYSARAIISIAATLTLFSIPSGRAYASAGDLDPKFGNGGKVVTPLGAVAQIEALAIQPDGKIIAAGVSMTRGISNAEDFAVVRYNTDGSLDPNFGHNGEVITDYFDDQDHVNAIGLQKDGKIITAGLARRGAELYFGLAGYNSDGTLDLSFGSGGKAVADLFGYGAVAYALAIQPDGKIVVGGIAYGPPPAYDADFGLARFNADGSLDLTFGVGGKAETDFGSFESIYSIAIEPDGKIVAAGETNSARTHTDFAIARYNTDGSLDKTFGLEGRVVSDFVRDDDFVTGVSLQADGKIVLAGEAFTSEHGGGFCLARYNKDGSLDSSFGSKGKVITEGILHAADAVVIQPNGKIIAAGLAIHGTDGDFGLARYNGNGSLDLSFGSAGIITTDFSGGERAFALEIEPDGKIVAAGYSYKADGVPSFALARYDAGDITAKTFDRHLHDDNSLLEFDSTSGDYRFTECSTGFTLSGTGRVKVRSCKIELSDSTADYSLKAKVKLCANTGKVSVDVFSQGKTYTLKDNDITDNNSPCR